MLKKIKKYKNLIVFILLYFLLKLLYLYHLKLPLSYDEAYYWDWSRILDWGYYSKPPMVAWLIKISTEIFGISEFAVRFPALVCNTLSLLFSYLLVDRYFERIKANYLVLTLAFLPILTVYSFIMTIDPPFILFWSIATYFFCLYLENSNYKNAILTGIFTGLGLLSKQTMFAFWILSLFYLIFFRKNLILKKASLFLIFLPFLIYFPNLYWNYTHQFVMFKHTEHHFSRIGFSFEKFFSFFIECLVIYSFFLLIFLYKGIEYIKKRSFFSQTLNFLYILSFPLSLFFILISIYIRLNTNWIMPFILSGFLFTFAYLKFDRNYKSFFYLNLIFIILISSIILYSGFTYDKAPSLAQPLFTKFRGWKELAKEVEKFYKPNIPIVVSHREIASSLAFYMKKHPYIYVIKTQNFPENQYQIWRDDRELNGKIVLVVKKWGSPPEYLKKAFKLSEIRIKITKKKYKDYSIWQGIWERSD